MTTPSVDWSSLEDAYGPATEVPRLLDEVRQAKREHAFSEALGNLYSHVLHQGTIYSASPFAVREVISMLRASVKDAQKRPALYELLNEFAHAARISHENGRFIPCCSGGDPAHGDAIRDELDRARDQFVEDLEDPNPQLRARACSLLAAFENADATVVELVRNKYVIEPDRHARHAIFDALMRVKASVRHWPAVLDAGLQRETEPEDRFPILFSQIQESKPPASDAIWRDFVKTFAAANAGQMTSSVDERFFEALTAFGQEDQCSLMLEALDLSVESGLTCALTARLLRSAFEDRRTGWDQTSYSQLPKDGSTPDPRNSMYRMAFRAMGLLLMMKLFPFLFRWKMRRMAKGMKSKPTGIEKIEFWGIEGNPPEIPTPLTPLQQRVLAALAQKPEVWIFRTNLWSLFKLPESSESLRAFVAQRFPPPRT